MNVVLEAMMSEGVVVLGWSRAISEAIDVPKAVRDSATRRNPMHIVA
jgi:hypothetical protein